MKANYEEFISLWDEDFNIVSMQEMQFLFHAIEIKFATGSKTKLLDIFNKIKKSNKNPKYLIEPISKSRLCMEIHGEERLNDGGIFFAGEMIQSQSSDKFRKERKGFLSFLPIGRDSGIAQHMKDVINFIVYVNPTTNKNIVMLEYIPFTAGIDKFVEYIKEFEKDEIDDITHKQKLGRDFLAFLKTVSKNNITVADFKLKKNLTKDEIKKIGYVDDVIEKLKNKELDFELILHWGKKQKLTLLDFLKQFFRINDISDLETIDFSELLNIFQIKTDNEAIPKINFMERMFKYKIIADKTYMEMHKNELYQGMSEFFINNLSKLIE